MPASPLHRQQYFPVDLATPPYKLDVSTQEFVPDQNDLRASILIGSTHSIPQFPNISLYLSGLVACAHCPPAQGPAAH